MRKRLMERVLNLETDAEEKSVIIRKYMRRSDGRGGERLIYVGGLVAHETHLPDLIRKLTQAQYDLSEGKTGEVK